jgi:hypothetical protein
MRKLRQLVLALMLLATFASIVAAHQIALKDGRIIQFEKYRVVDGQLFYVNSDGKEVQVALSSIDLDRTRVLSASDSPPLELPGLFPNNVMVSPKDGQSLGEIARQVRPKDTKVTAQRTFTDDDVAHGSPSLPSLATPSSSVTTDDQYRARMEQVENWIQRKRDMTARQLSESAAGETQFLGREDWERRLYAQMQKLLNTVRSDANVLHRILEAPTPQERASAKAAWNTVEVELDNDRAGYDALEIEGARKAADWKKSHQ